MKLSILPLLTACLLSTPAAAGEPEVFCADPACVVVLTPGTDFDEYERPALRVEFAEYSVPLDAGVAPAQSSPAPPAPDKGLGSSPSWEVIFAIVVTFWNLVSAIVAATATKRDDELLARVMQRFSFLRSFNVPSGIFGRLSLPGTRPRPNQEGI